MTRSKPVTQTQKPTYVETKTLIHYIKTNRKFAKQYELSWLKELVIYMDFKKVSLATEIFLEHIKSKKRKSNKKQSGFYIKIFEELGAKYFYVKKRNSRATCRSNLERP